MSNQKDDTGEMFSVLAVLLLIDLIFIFVLNSCSKKETEKQIREYRNSVEFIDDVEHANHLRDGLRISEINQKYNSLKEKLETIPIDEDPVVAPKPPPEWVFSGGKVISKSVILDGENPIWVITIQSTTSDRGCGFYNKEIKVSKGVWETVSADSETRTYIKHAWTAFKNPDVDHREEK